MCLETIWSDEEMNEWLKERPEVLTLEKGVTVHAENYGSFHATCFFACDYTNGLNVANPEYPTSAFVGGKYWPNFHFYQKAPDWMLSLDKVIKCLIRKSWVSAIGTDICGRTVIVASQAIFPHYPETDPRYEDLPQEEKVEAKEVVTV